MYHGVHLSTTNKGQPKALLAETERSIVSSNTPHAETEYHVQKWNATFGQKPKPTAYTVMVLKPYHALQTVKPAKWMKLGPDYDSISAE